jgi:hypothetical protein
MTSWGNLGGGTTFVEPVAEFASNLPMYLALVPLRCQVVRRLFYFVCPEMAHHAPFTPRAVKLIAGYRLFKVLRSIRVCNLRIIRSTPALNSSYPRVNDGN